MNIQKARQITGFEKCESNDHRCEQCREKQSRYNSENYLRTSYEYDEGDYACNKCVKAKAVAIEEGRCH